MKAPQKTPSRRVVAPIRVEAGARVAQWERLLGEWPPRCVDSAARRRRKRWRRKCVALAAAQEGLPPEIRRRVWSTLLAAAAEDGARAPEAPSERPAAAAASPAAPAPAGGAASPPPPATAAPAPAPELWARARRRSDDGRRSPSFEALPREIALDVPRTYAAADGGGPPGSTEDRARATATRLRRLLTHFARTAPPDQAYCQGMNFLGGTLLRVFDAKADTLATTVDAGTAHAFRGLVALVAPLYAPDFRGLRELVAVAGALLPRFAPRLAGVLAAEGLDLMPLVSAWCLALFASTRMPGAQVLVCWDLLLLGTPSRRELSLERCAGGRPADAGADAEPGAAAPPPAAPRGAAARARRALGRAAAPWAAARRAWGARGAAARAARPPRRDDAALGCAAERHVVLLRLCLVMLRRGDAAVGAGAAEDGLEALGALGAGFFPADAAALCGAFRDCAVERRAVRAAAAQHRRGRRPRSGPSRRGPLELLRARLGRRRRAAADAAGRRPAAGDGDGDGGDDPCARTLPARAPWAADDDDPCMATL